MLLSFRYCPFLMQAHFELLEYMRRDITDSIKGVASPGITLAMDYKLPISIDMITTNLPSSVEAFDELVKKCANVSTVFNLFTLLNSALYHAVSRSSNNIRKSQ